MRNSRGMTLMEIMIVMVILAIIASIGVPAYTRAVEMSRMEEARTNLGIIHMGQRVWRINNANLYRNSGNNLTDDQVNLSLNVDISSNFYPLFSIATAGGGATYTAATQRAGATPVDWTFTGAGDANGNLTITCAGTACPCADCTN